MKLAIVTGASRGLGLAFLTQLKKRGYHVVGISRSLATKGGDDGEVRPDQVFASDLSMRAGLEFFLNQETVWKTDATELVLVNNAGSLGQLGPEFSPEELEQLFQLNLLSPIAMMYEALKTKQKTVKILNVSSGAALKAYPGWQQYCTSKAALSMSSKVCAADYDAGLIGEGKNLLVFEYAPGVVNTEMQVELREASPADFPNQQRFKTMHEDGVLVSPEDSARQGLEYLLDREHEETFLFHRFA